ncbi:putative LUC7 related protein [Paratrimastix pyriformis]|uniref:LUC7 related protein n=1 Tax=Paratrimastix pyriformis TaxID=342808 RepID=A0ABQ8UQB8_9EUKA|nr:putative LUC7 related protein [Paratrimastix pyriformis]
MYVREDHEDVRTPREISFPAPSNRLNGGRNLNERLLVHLFMTDIFRQQLDLLMGLDRNGEVTQAGSYKDPDQCHYFLCGCCPGQLFLNTKVAVKSCDREHNEVYKGQYERDFEGDRKAGIFDRLGYASELERYLDRLVAECDRRIDQERHRLEVTLERQQDTAVEIQSTELSLKINELMEQAEKMGEEGRVSESMQLMQQVEDLKRQKDAANSMAAVRVMVVGPASSDSRNANGDKVRPAEGMLASPCPVVSECPFSDPGIDPATPTTFGTTQQAQKLRVCEVCGALLSLTETDRRLADHFGGKLHLGYLAIRKHLVFLRDARASFRAERAAELERDRARTRSALWPPLPLPPRRPIPSLMLSRPFIVSSGPPQDAEYYPPPDGSYPPPGDYPPEDNYHREGPRSRYPPPPADYGGEYYDGPRGDSKPSLSFTDAGTRYTISSDLDLQSMITAAGISHQMPIVHVNSATIFTSVVPPMPTYAKVPPPPVPPVVLPAPKKIKDAPAEPETPSGPSFPLFDLPPELLNHVLVRLPIATLIALRQSCRFLADLLKRDVAPLTRLGYGLSDEPRLPPRADLDTEAAKGAQLSRPWREVRADPSGELLTPSRPLSQLSLTALSDSLADLASEAPAPLYRVCIFGFGSTGKRQFLRDLHCHPPPGDCGQEMPPASMFLQQNDPSAFATAGVGQPPNGWGPLGYRVTRPHRMVLPTAQGLVRLDLMVAFAPGDEGYPLMIGPQGQLGLPAPQPPFIVPRPLIPFGGFPAPAPFGAPAPAPALGLFGAPTPAQAPLFGAACPAPGLFGAPAPAAVVGLFGAPAAAPAPAPAPFFRDAAPTAGGPQEAAPEHPLKLGGEAAWARGWKPNPAVQGLFLRDDELLEGPEAARLPRMDGALILFEVASRMSYKQVPTFYRDVQRTCSDSASGTIPAVLVANKIDVRDVTVHRSTPPLVPTTPPRGGHADPAGPHPGRPAGRRVDPVRLPQVATSSEEPVLRATMTAYSEQCCPVYHFDDNDDY